MSNPNIKPELIKEARADQQLEWLAHLGQPMLYDGGLYVERHDNKAPSQHAVLKSLKFLTLPSTNP